MIEKIERFKTFDGKEFETVHAAEEYVCDVVCEYLDKRLRPISSSCRTDVYKIVMTLCPDFDSALRLYRDLNAVFCGSTQGYKEEDNALC